MKRIIYFVLFALFASMTLCAQGVNLGRVTAVTGDKKHSISGDLIQYTDAYGKKYLELEIGEKKPMVVQELRYAPYDYQYYAYLGSRNIDMPIMNQSDYYYFNFIIPLENPGRLVKTVQAISTDGKKTRTFKIYKYDSPGGTYYEAEHGAGNRRAEVVYDKYNERFKYYVRFYDEDHYYFNF